MSEILLVGARAEHARMLAAVLEPLGYSVATARSGAEALELLDERAFALLIAEAGSTLEAEARKRNIPLASLAEGLSPYVDEAMADADADRRALERSEALLRGAFEAAPIGKTVLDADLRIVRANRAFALLLERETTELLGTEITGLVVPDDRGKLAAALARVAAGDLGPDDPDRSGFDVHLRSRSRSDAWACAYLSSIDPTELGEPLLMIQWVDLSPRRHAEQARAELQLEHRAREQAEATAERLNKLQVFTDALETLALDELLSELALLLADKFNAELAEVRVDEADGEGPFVVRAAAGRILAADHDNGGPPAEAWREIPLVSEGTGIGSLRLVPPAQASFAEADRALLGELADRAALSIRRAQRHEQEHRIASTLQRGLLPTRLPDVAGLELTAHYEPAGEVSKVGGDWYDVLELSEGRVGIVLGDVAGKGIPAAPTMGELRSVARAFALGDDQTRPPSEVLTRLNRHQLTLGAEEMFTVLYAIIDPRRGEVSWANAGHPPPLLHRGAGESRYLEGGDGLMGIDEIVYTDLHEHIGERDTLIFYTDGLVERRGEALDAGLARLMHAVATGPADPPALCRHIVAEVVPAEPAPSDDVTILVARRRG